MRNNLATEEININSCCSIDICIICLIFLSLYSFELVYWWLILWDDWIKCVSNKKVLWVFLYFYSSMIYPNSKNAVAENFFLNSEFNKNYRSFSKKSPYVCTCGVMWNYFTSTSRVSSIYTPKSILINGLTNFFLRGHFQWNFVIRTVRHASSFNRCQDRRHASPGLARVDFVSRVSAARRGWSWQMLYASSLDLFRRISIRERVLAGTKYLSDRGKSGNSF